MPVKDNLIYLTIANQDLLVKRKLEKIVQSKLFYSHLGPRLCHNRTLRVFFPITCFAALSSLSYFVSSLSLESV